MSKKRGNYSRKRKSAFRKDNAGSIVPEQMLVPMYNILIVFMAVLFLWGKIDSIANDSFYDEKYYAEDLGIIMHAVYASPENMEFTYVANFSDFDVFQTSENISLSEASSSSWSSIMYFNRFFYGTDLNINFKYDKIKETLSLTKILNNIHSREDILNPEYNLNKIYCPASPISRILSPSIGVDIIGDSANQGKKDPDNPSRTEFSLSKKIAGAFKASWTSSGTVDIIVPSGSPMSEQDRLDALKTKDISIKIGIGYSDNPYYESVVAYIPPETSQNHKASESLACKIINNFLNSFQSLSSAIIIQSDDKSLLQDNKYAVYLEIGNINTPEDISIINPSQAGNIIKNAVIEVNKP